MKKPAIILLSLALLVTMIFLSACDQSSSVWWLEMNYLDETQQTDYRLNMPITIEEDNSLSGLGILEVRKLVEGDTTGFPECVVGEVNGIRLRGEIMVIGEYRDDHVLVQSLEPTGGPESFSYIFYCTKDHVERNVKVFNLKLDTPAGQVFSNYIIDALYVFSEGMLQNPMDPVDDFSNHDEHGFSFVLHKGELPESKMVPTPYVAAE